MIREHVIALMVNDAITIARLPDSDTKTNRAQRLLVDLKTSGPLGLEAIDIIIQQESKNDVL
jgi:hypothetical protein